MDQPVCAVKPNTFFADVVNSDENWDIINATGITWLADEQADGSVRVVTYSHNDIQEVKNALESLSSNPYPNFL
jgi:hypothetical protein